MKRQNFILLFLRKLISFTLCGLQILGGGDVTLLINYGCLIISSNLKMSVWTRETESVRYKSEVVMIIIVFSR